MLSHLLLCYVSNSKFYIGIYKKKKKSQGEYKPCVFQRPDMMITVARRRWRRPVWREIRDEMEVRLQMAFDGQRKEFVFMLNLPSEGKIKGFQVRTEVT